MTKSINNLTKISCSAVNLSKFLNICREHDITFYNLQRLDGNRVEFELTDKDMAKLTSLNLTNYHYEVVNVGGLRKALNTVIYRIGLIVGLALSIIGVFVLNNRLLHIHVYGLTSVAEDAVVESVREYGVSTLSKMDFANEELENYLSKEFKFSLVSVVKKGNSLIISVKEELPDIEEQYTPIIADFNMVIQNIQVYSGTARVKAGDVVRKGDVLIEPYVVSGEDKVYVPPCGDISVIGYFSASYIFSNSREVVVRTGNKQLISHELRLGKYLLGKSSKENMFSEYEIEVVDSSVSQYFLPLKMKKTYAYETMQKSIECDFEKEKNNIISKLKNEVLHQIPSNMSVDKENILIKDFQNGKIINVCFECVTNLKYTSK